MSYLLLFIHHPWSLLYLCLVGELIAHEITMGDNDRIALMQMVKEGKITTETALQVVSMMQ